MKTYQKPEVDILDIMTEEMMIVTSPLEQTKPDLKDAPTTTANSGNLSRQKDLWETYEEPEY